MPVDRTVKYEIIVTEILTKKAKTDFTYLTVGWNTINLPNDATAPTVDIKISKLLFTSVL